MPLQAGDPVLSGDVSESRGAASGVEAGDAVMIDDAGDMDAADTDAGDLAGIARFSDNNEGRGNTLHLSGAAVAAAASGVTDGDRVGAGNATDGTTGLFVVDADGEGLALSDEGGTWYSDEDTYDVPAGYAVVKL